MKSLLSLATAHPAFTDVHDAVTFCAVETTPTVGQQVQTLDLPSNSFIEYEDSRLPLKKS